MRRLRGLLKRCADAHSIFQGSAVFEGVSLDGKSVFVGLWDLDIFGQKERGLSAFKRALGRIG